LLGQIIVYVEQVRNDSTANVGPLDLAQLENQRILHMLLLGRRLADVELTRLTVVVGETLRTDAGFFARDLFCEGVEGVVRRLARVLGGVPEFGSKLTRPMGFRIAMWPSCWNK